jgi:hypothetical protein
MSLTTRRPAHVIELHFENQGGNVRVVPPDRDIMAMPIEMAIEACRAFKNQIRFKDQFDLLVHRLGTWIGERRASVSSAYLTSRDSGLLFLVVTNGREFNQELEEAITELDLEIAQDGDYNLIRFGVHVLPECDRDSVQSFLSPLVIELKVSGVG